MIEETGTSNNNLSRIDELSVLDIFQAIRTGSKTISIITLIFIIFSIVYSLNLEDTYQSDSVLISRESNGQNSISQISNLATIAGLGFSSGSDPLIETMEIISSREFTKHLLTFDEILPSMMAAKSYDAVSKRIIFDPNSYDSENNVWVHEETANTTFKPSYLEAHRVFTGKLLKISKDSKTGLLNISIEHISPIFAKELLELTIHEANSLLRKRDIESSKEALEFLKKELRRTNLVEIKESINQIIEVQLEKQMMAKIYEDYSLIVLEPPFIPDEKAGPQRSLIVLFSSVVGLILAVFYVLLKFLFSPGRLRSN